MVNRREFLLGAGAACCTTALPARSAAALHRPNVLIVITDEQSASAASYRMGSQYIHTPNMDSIAAGGRVYTRAYCSNPLCVPSRTAMFTGQYPTVTGVMDNSGQYRTEEIMSRYKLLGKIFQEAGYDTGYFGKWHQPVPLNRPEVHGFAVHETASIDTQTASAASRFLEQKRSRPFLAVASFLNPHNICEWARGQQLPLGPIGAAPPADECPPLRADHGPQRDEPDILTLVRRSYQAAPMFPVGNFDDAKWRQYQWAYYRLVEKADAQIGVVLQALRASGQDRSTLIVMLADHGDCQGAHGWNQKTVFYEEASRVPFVLRYPGKIAAGESQRLVNTGIDLIPTLCDYAGIAAPEHLPGLSVADASRDPRRYVVVSNHMIQGVPVNGYLPTPQGRMVRGQRYKYCVYSQGTRRESLVDLDNDPGEMVNLAGEARMAGVLREHRAMLAEWSRQTHDSFPLIA